MVLKPYLLPADVVVPRFKILAYSVYAPFSNRDTPGQRTKSKTSEGSLNILFLLVTPRSRTRSNDSETSLLIIKIQKGRIKDDSAFWFAAKSSFSSMPRIFIGVKAVFAHAIDSHLHTLNQSRKGTLHRFGINI